VTLVSVVVPTRNRPRLVACTLRSILAQRSVELEVMVVDDGSSPPLTIAADRRVHLLRNEISSGVSAARNTGLAAASGDWVAFCDDDDVWAPDKLYAQLAGAAESRAGWAYTGDITVDEQLRVIGGGPSPSPEQVMRLLPRYNAVPGSASGVAVAADLLAHVGGFDTNLRRTEDWDLWLRLARHGPPAAVDHPLVALRQHVNNVIFDRDRLIEEVAVLTRRYAIPIDPLAARRRAAWGLLRAGRRWAAVREYIGLVARGDRRSLGRAVVALLHPDVGTPRMFALAGMPRDARWAAEARVWLEPLAKSCEASRGTVGQKRLRLNSSSTRPYTDS
jgi:glycosyltransferase involved in cell wall biosynthesis